MTNKIDEDYIERFKYLREKIDPYLKKELEEKLKNGKTLEKFHKLDIRGNDGVIEFIKLYEKLIPEIERHLKGQYYTPEFIADIISELCIKHADDKILDCSCGNGIFLVSAYNKLLKFDGNTHQKIIHQLFGFDINYFSAHLAILNLILRDSTSKNTNWKIFPVDFFCVRKDGKNLIPLDDISFSDINQKNHMFLKLARNFDAIITNPPYIEAREIGGKKYIEDIREIALDNDNQLPKSIGIHGYFFTHANHFLKNGGRIGFIVSTTFLETMGGWKLCEFFLNNFKIKYLIRFMKNVFDSADVKTIIIILEKSINKKDRDENITKFIKAENDIDILEFTQNIKELNKNTKNDKFQLLKFKQAFLYDEKNWMLFFNKFEIIDLFLRIFKREDLTNLQDYCEIRSCFKKGGYSFFFIDAEENNKLKIEKEYLEPIIHSPKVFHKLGVFEDDIREYVLKIESLNSLMKTKTQTKEYVKNWMNKKIKLKRGKDRGKFIRGIQNTPTFKDDDKWFDVLNNNIKGDLLFQGYINENMRCFVNECGAYSTANFITIKLKDEKYIPVLGLILNSSLLQFYFEILGKIMGAGALSVANYLLKRTKIPRLDSLDQYLINRADKILNHLKLAKIDSDEYQIIRKSVDEWVFDFFNVSKDDRIKIIEDLKYMMEKRITAQDKN
ncbi:MAG: hypothetical protein EU551_03190 [Promethearchaeota archaeon]|nr:MAG: hypothetical protein EU551_03190 [Candidatus Lokiarchaeota archaeon]